MHTYVNCLMEFLFRYVPIQGDQMKLMGKSLKNGSKCPLLAILTQDEINEKRQQQRAAASFAGTVSLLRKYKMMDKYLMRHHFIFNDVS